MKTIFLFLSLVALPFLAWGQEDKIYYSLEEALKQPELVYKLDLRGNQLKTLPASISQLQKLWQRAKVIMVPKSNLHDLPTIKVGKWSEQDWTDYLIGKSSSLGISEENCRFVSNFITNHAKTHFSPKLIHQMLLINQKFGVERWVPCLNIDKIIMMFHLESQS